MKQRLLLFALLAQLFAFTASAYDALVGGICYNLDTVNKTAEVTNKSVNDAYTGSINIPTEITYNNVRYKVTSIGENAFHSSTELKSVFIASSISEIKRAAFANCTSLTSIIIPSTVNRIQESTFAGCTKLESITIPESITLIEENAFKNTKWYNSWFYEQSDGPCYINDKILLKYKGAMPANATIEIKEGTICIASRAFAGNSNLTSLVIPESVDYIGSAAFYNCNNLSSITWPSSLKYFGGTAFHKCFNLTHVDVPCYKEGGDLSGSIIRGDSCVCRDGFHFFRCDNLKSATLAEGITEVSKCMFRRCANLTTISLPSTIKSISDRSPFQECPSLTNVYVSMPYPVTIYSETFPTRYAATLYVPKGCKAAYQNAEYWGDFKEIVETVPVTGISLLPELVELTKGGCTTLTATVLPAGASNKEVIWKSSDPAVATVEEGVVTAVGKGTAIITATTMEGRYTTTCGVTVIQHVTAVELNKSSLSLKVGGFERLSVNVFPEDADNKNVKWSSSDDKVVLVDDNGNVVGLKAGSADVKVESNDNSEAYDVCKVTVKQPVTGIKLSQNQATLEGIGKLVVLEANVEPEDASNKNVKWRSSDESVCIVANGTVVAVGGGVCVIIATTEDGDYMATCTVTVRGDSVKGVNGSESITIESISDAAGHSISTLQRGINILRMSDGTTKKVLIK